VSRQGQRSACRSAGSHTAGLLPPRAFGGRRHDALGASPPLCNEP